MTSTVQGHRTSLAGGAVALCLLLAGCGALGGDTEAGAASTSTPTAPPSASSGAASSSSASASSGAASTTASATRAPSVDGRVLEAQLDAARRRTAEESAADPTPDGVLPESAPVRVSIPAVGIDSDLLHLGLRDDGTLAVPPGDPGSPASWYTHSPTPGQRGPAVLLGHVSDTAGEDGVFARLPEVSPGDRIEVTREDGTTAVFEVQRGEQYDKGEFPTDEVYGNTPDAQLRVITCDGYNPLARRWEDNFVVYASLVR